MTTIAFYFDFFKRQNRFLNLLQLNDTERILFFLKVWEKTWWICNLLSVRVSFLSLENHEFQSITGRRKGYPAWYEALNVESVFKQNVNLVKSGKQTLHTLLCDNWEDFDLVKLLICKLGASLACSNYQLKIKK